MKLRSRAVALYDPTRPRRACRLFGEPPKTCDNLTMTEVVAATTSAPPAPPAPLKSGYRTSEAYITLLTMILGAFPSSGLLTADPPSIAKIVGMLIAGLAALNYTAQRTALKRAYLAALGTDSTQLSRVPQIATSALLVAVVATLVITQPSCGTAANCQDPKNAQSAACVVKGAIVDCTGVSSLPSAVAVVTPIIERLIVSATQSDGSIQWSSIEQQIIDLALQYGTGVIA